MNKQNLLTFPDLKPYLRQHWSIYTNPNDIDFHLAEELWISVNIWNQAPVSFDMIMSLEEDDPQFSEKLGVQSVEDIDRLDVEYLWQHYHKGNAKVVANMYELFGLAICFQQVRGKTHVTIEGKGTEIIEVMQEVSDDINWFRTYIRNNAQRWYKMSEVRDMGVA